MKPVLLALLLLPCAAAAQPYSHSMAQCAGLAQALSQWTRDGETAAAADFAAGAWVNAAVVQAHAEGVADPASQVHAMTEAALQDWLSKGKWTVFSADFRDWASYCRKFGDHMGVKLTPDA